MIDAASLIIWILVGIGTIIIGTIVTLLIVVIRMRRRTMTVWEIIQPNGDISKYRTPGTQEYLFDDKNRMIFHYDSTCSLTVKWWGIPYGKKIMFYWNNPSPINPFGDEILQILKKNEEKWKKEMKALIDDQIQDLTSQDPRLSAEIKKAGFLSTPIKQWSARDMYNYVDTKIVRDFLLSEDVLKVIQMICFVIAIGMLAAIVLSAMSAFKTIPVTQCLDINQTAAACKQAFATRGATGGF